ncbi:hypothetical protein [Cellulosimicrobium sp. Marseille-Q8652]
MPRHASVWPYHEVDRADYEGCAVPVRTADQHARQYAADTVRLADPKSRGGRTARTVPNLARDEHQAEARRLHQLADRRQALADQQRALLHTDAADAFEADARHFRRLADWHAGRGQQPLRGGGMMS